MKILDFQIEKRVVKWVSEEMLIHVVYIDSANEHWILHDMVNVSSAIHEWRQILNLDSCIAIF